MASQPPTKRTANTAPIRNPYARPTATKRPRGGDSRPHGCPPSSREPEVAEAPGEAGEAVPSAPQLQLKQPQSRPFPWAFGSQFRHTSPRSQRGLLRKLPAARGPENERPPPLLPSSCPLAPQQPVSKPSPISSRPNNPYAGARGRSDSSPLSSQQLTQPSKAPPPIACQPSNPYATSRNRSNSSLPSRFSSSSGGANGHSSTSTTPGFPLGRPEAAAAPLLPFLPPPCPSSSARPQVLSSQHALLPNQRPPAPPLPPPGALGAGPPPPFSLPRPPSWSHDPKSTARRTAPTTPVSDTASAPPRSCPGPALPAVKSSGAAPAAPLVPVAAPSPHDTLLPQPLRYDPRSLQPPDDGHRRTLVSAAQLSQPLCNGWELRSHQKRAVLFGLARRRAVLALDMGTGKTVVGCVWAKAFVHAFRGCRVVVLCPVSLQEQWRRTAQEATGLAVSDRPFEGKGLDGDYPNSGNHHEVNDFPPDRPDTTPTVYIASWAKVPARVAGRYVVVADEAHSMQSMTAARTKDALRLVDAPGCLGVLLLTGTPLKNGKPINLYPLLKAVRHPLARCQRSFEEHFCQGRHQSCGAGRNPVWKATGAANLDQLRELTSSHVLYLHKDDVLKELPPQTRIIHKVPVSHQRQAQHTRALQELAQAYRCGAGGDGDGDAILGAIQRVRFVSSLAKVDAAVNLAQQVLEAEPAVVVFSSFLEVCKTIHAQLAAAGWAGELLTGETPPKKRQDMVDRFQRGLTPVFVCTFGAGGVGLTLTAACSVILVDRPWTPGEASQAEDRVRRIGQTKPVRSLWISAFDLDEQIDALLEQKQQTATAVLKDGSRVGHSTGGQSKLSIHQLLQRLLPQGNGTAAAGLKQTTLLQFSQSEVHDR